MAVSSYATAIAELALSAKPCRLIAGVIDAGAMRLAALTMAYNEPVWAGVWARYYAGQVGAGHCYLIDHGSDDESVAGLPVQIERVSRDTLDEEARAALISDRVAELLQSYDAVIHADVDELVVPDPHRYADLAAYASDRGPEVVTTIGLDVQHLPSEEPALVLNQPILMQRRWARFSAAMCKPAFVRRPVRWAPGFHRANAELVWDGLFLLHLRYADLAFGLARLRRTRGQKFASSLTNLHQRVSDDEFSTMVQNIARLRRREIAWDASVEPLWGWLDRVRALQCGGGDWLSLSGDELWSVPPNWTTLF